LFNEEILFFKSLSNWTVRSSCTVEGQKKRTFQYPKSRECSRLAERMNNQPVPLWNFINA
jgi:hypothetical protein